MTCQTKAPHLNDEGATPRAHLSHNRTSKGQITIPAAVRRYLQLVAGDQVLIEIFEGYFTVKRLPR